MRLLVPMASLAPTGGIEINALQVCRELARRGHEIYVPFVEDGALAGDWREFATLTRVPAFWWSPRNPVRDTLALRGAVAAARYAAADVIYLNRPEHLVWGLAARIAARRPLVCHLHASPGSRAVVEVGRCVTHFIAVSHFIARAWTAGGVSPDRITVIHNGISGSDYRPPGPGERALARAALGIPPEVFTTLYYGRIAAEKGVATLMPAWREVAAAEPKAILLVAGVPIRPSASERAFIDRLQAVGGPSCRWLPVRPDVLTLLHACDLVVLPAEYQDPLPRVVIEGMASGRLVVATRVGGIPEMLTGEFARYLCEPGDPRSLSDAVLRAKADLARDPALGARAVEHVAANFGFVTAVDAVEEQLRRAAAPDRRRP